jgi:hypothetical protein
MGRKNYKTVGLVCYCIFLAACVKDQPSNPLISLPVNIGKGNVYIVCEGQYGYGNASLGLYVPSTDSVYEDVYYAANNNKSMGDVFQSMVQIGSNLFLCVNNSNKIVVINDTTWKLVNNIPVFQPRYILPISSTRAYVSSLYSNKVYIINTQALVVMDSISLPTMNPESMLLYNYTVFSCSWDTSNRNIYELNIITNSLIQADAVAGYAAQEILMDKDQKLWILSGNSYDGKNAFLTRMDPDTRQILQSYSFPSQANPVRPVLNNTKDTLYFIDANQNGGTDYNGIYRMGINDANLPQKAFIPASANQYYWALGIDPATGYIYVGDPKGFSQKGTVYIYQANGTLVKQFNTGVGPGHFYFD